MEIQVLELKGQCKESHTDVFAPYTGDISLVRTRVGEKVITATVNRFETEQWKRDIEESALDPTKYFPPDSIILRAEENDFKVGPLELRGYSERCPDLDCKHQINFDAECKLVAFSTPKAEASDAIRPE